MLGQQTGLGLAETHRPAASTALHLAHEEDPDTDQQQKREPVEQHGQEDIALFRRFLDADVHIGFAQDAHSLGIGRRQYHFETLARRGHGEKCIALNGRAFDFIALHPVQKIRVGRPTLGRRRISRAADHLNQDHHQDEDHGPDRNISHRHAFIRSIIRSFTTRYGHSDAPAPVGLAARRQLAASVRPFQAHQTI